MIRAGRLNRLGQAVYRICSFIDYFRCLTVPWIEILFFFYNTVCIKQILPLYYTQYFCNRELSTGINVFTIFMYKVVLVVHASALRVLRSSANGLHPGSCMLRKLGYNRILPLG